MAVNQVYREYNITAGEVFSKIYLVVTSSGQDMTGATATCHFRQSPEGSLLLSKTITLDNTVSGASHGELELSGTETAAFPSVVHADIKWELSGTLGPFIPIKFKLNVKKAYTQ